MTETHLFQMQDLSFLLVDISMPSGVWERMHLIKDGGPIVKYGVCDICRNDVKFCAGSERGITCQSNFKLLMLSLRKLTHFKGGRN